MAIYNINFLAGFSVVMFDEVGTSYVNMKRCSKYFVPSPGNSAKYKSFTFLKKFINDFGTTLG